MSIPRNARRFDTVMAMEFSASTTLDGEIEVVIVYTVRPGTPASGAFGPPENYDPGSPPEVTVHGIQTLHGPVKDLTWLGTTWIEDDEEMCDALVADWEAGEKADEDAEIENRLDHHP